MKKVKDDNEPQFPSVCYIYEGDQKLALTSERAWSDIFNKVNGLVLALEKIERWFGEFPDIEKEDGEIMTYLTAYGSNGQRDFMRQVARDALIEFMKKDGWEE